jgi:hypothetical protein
MRRRFVPAAEAQYSTLEAGQNDITVIKATGDKSHNQSGGRLLTENTLNGFQATKMEVTHASYLADVLQLTVQGDT